MHPTISDVLSMQMQIGNQTIILVFPRAESSRGTSSHISVCVDLLRSRAQEADRGHHNHSQAKMRDVTRVQLSPHGRATSMRTKAIL